MRTSPSTVSAKRFLTILYQAPSQAKSLCEKTPTLSIEKRDESGSEKWKVFPTGESGARSRTLPRGCPPLWKTS